VKVTFLDTEETIAMSIRPIESSAVSGRAEEQVALLERKVAALTAQLAKLLDVVIIDAVGNVSIKAKNKLTLKSSSALNIDASGAMEIHAASTLQLKGAKIDLN
jgi:hypothetical protein